MQNTIVNCIYLVLYLGVFISTIRIYYSKYSPDFICVINDIKVPSSSSDP